MALRQLCVGDLAGMFDGPTSPGVNLDAQMVVLDLSAMDESQEVRIMIGAPAPPSCRRSKKALVAEAREPPPKTILLDEAWHIFSSGIENG